MEGIIIQKTSSFNPISHIRRSYENVCARLDNEWCYEVCTPYADGFDYEDQSDFIKFDIHKPNVQKIELLFPSNPHIDDIQIFYKSKNIQEYVFTYRVLPKHSNLALI